LAEHAWGCADPEDEFDFARGSMHRGDLGSMASSGMFLIGGR